MTHMEIAQLCITDSPVISHDLGEESIHLGVLELAILIKVMRLEEWLQVNLREGYERCDITDM